jgi:hypothetical protein
MPLSNYQRVRLWRKRFPEKVAEQSRRRYKKNRDKIVAYKKRWISQHLDHYRKMDRERAKRRRTQNPEKQAARSLKFRQALRQKQIIQAGRAPTPICELCGETVTKIVFDHCHSKGHFRGWICDRCNRVLGSVKDDISILNKMIIYLNNSHTHAIDGAYSEMK